MHATAKEMTTSSLLPRRTLGLIVATTISLLAFSGCFSPHNPIKVVVKNDGTIPIEDVHLWMKNGIDRITRISPGQSASIKIYPPVESSLELEFRSGRDNWRHVVFDTYTEFDPFVIRINDAGTIWYQWKEYGPEVTVAVFVRLLSAPWITPDSPQFPPMSQSSDRHEVLQQHEVSGQLEAIDLQNAAAKGPAMAPVTVVEFCDLTVTCSEFAKIADQLLASIPRKFASSSNTPP